MEFTLEELKLRLCRLDEVTLVEELGINAEDIVDRFTDLIERDFSRLADLVDEGDNEEEGNSGE